MALLLTKNTTQINVQGTDIELSSVYVRIVFTCQLDGSLTITYKTYLNFASFMAGKEIATDIVNMTYNFVILETETQSLETALLYMQQVFVELGYNAAIVD
jgi:hypothetical protein